MKDADTLLQELRDDENEERLRARAAALREKGKEIVTCRVLKMGDHKIFTGEHDPVTGQGFTRPRGDKFKVEHRYAEGFEERGFVEIMEDEPGAKAPEPAPAPAPDPAPKGGKGK